MADPDYRSNTVRTLRWLDTLPDPDVRAWGQSATWDEPVLERAFVEEALPSLATVELAVTTLVEEVVRHASDRVLNAVLHPAWCQKNARFTGTTGATNALGSERAMVRAGFKAALRAGRWSAIAPLERTEVSAEDPADGRWWTTDQTPMWGVALGRRSPFGSATPESLGAVLGWVRVRLIEEAQTRWPKGAVASVYEVPPAQMPTALWHDARHQMAMTALEYGDLERWEAIVRAGPERLITPGALVAAVQGRRWETALAFVEHVQKHGFDPTPRSWKALEHQPRMAPLDREESLSDLGPRLIGRALSAQASLKTSPPALEALLQALLQSPWCGPSVPAALDEQASQASHAWSPKMAQAWFDAFPTTTTTRLENWWRHGSDAAWQAGVARWVPLEWTDALWREVLENTARPALPSNANRWLVDIEAWAERGLALRQAWTGSPDLFLGPMSVPQQHQKALESAWRHRVTTTLSSESPPASPGRAGPRL